MRIINRKKLTTRIGLNLNLFSKKKIKLSFKKENFRKINNSYLNQIRELQKVRIIYGVSVYIIKKFIYILRNTNLDVFLIFINFICCRIDYLLYKSGFFFTRISAKQRISHGLILLNRIKINIHSIIVRDKDRILFLFDNHLCHSPLKWFIKDKFTGEFIFLKKLYIFAIENINLFIILSLFKKIF